MNSTPDILTDYAASDFIEQMRDAVMLVDLYGNILACNHELCIRTGFSREELVGATPGIWHQSDENYGDMTREIISATLTSGFWRGLIPFQSTSGVSRVSEVLTTPFRDNAGNVVAILSVSRDVTSEVQPKP